VGRNEVGLVAPWNDYFVAIVETLHPCPANPSNWTQTPHAIAIVFDDVGALMIRKRDGGGLRRTFCRVGISRQSELTALLTRLVLR